MTASTEDEIFEAELKREFLSEASELIKDFEEELLRFESEGPSEGAVDRLFRIAHTIKGSGYAVKLNSLGGFVHKVENVLSEVREERLELTTAMIDVFLDSVDMVKKMIAQTTNEGSDDVDANDLLKALADFLTEKVDTLDTSDGFGFFDEEQSNPQSDEESTSKGQVLIADDEEAIRDLISHFLESNGFEVTEATNGKEALEICQSKSFDVIFTDLSMPIMGGLDFVNEFRKTNHATPILVVSGQAGPSDLKILINAKIDGFVEKPFNEKDLIMKLHACMKIKSMRDNIASIADKSFEAFSSMVKILADIPSPEDSSENDRVREALEKQLDDIATLTTQALAI